MPPVYYPEVLSNHRSMAFSVSVSRLDSALSADVSLIHLFWAFIGKVSLDRWPRRWWRSIPPTEEFLKTLSWTWMSSVTRITSRHWTETRQSHDINLFTRSIYSFDLCLLMIHLLGFVILSSRSFHQLDHYLNSIFTSTQSLPLLDSYVSSIFMISWSLQCFLITLVID